MAAPKLTVKVVNLGDGLTCTESNYGAKYEGNEVVLLVQEVSERETMVKKTLKCAYNDYKTFQKEILKAVRQYNPSWKFVSPLTSDDNFRMVDEAGSEMELSIDIFTPQMQHINTKGLVFSK